MPIRSIDGNPVEVLASEFVERQRRGERPTIAEYASQHPQWADDIRKLFPTILALEQIRALQEESADRAAFAAKRPKKLGDFRIVREIGRGGMGVVYEGVQESLRRRVAVKVLARSSRLDDSHRRRFLREAQVAGRLHHTNIVPVLGVGEDQGLDFYVMQYIEGIGLDAVIARLRKSKSADRSELRLAPFCRRRKRDTTTADAADTQNFNRETARQGGPANSNSSRSGAGDSSISSGAPIRRPCETFWQDVALVGLQVAQALDYAHAQGILHRDIKPANLLIDGDATVWVADFGLAKGREHETVSRTGEILGTLLYMAPEQWRGVADGRSDIYSLGVTLYELLTLAVPSQIQDRIQSFGKTGLSSVVSAPRKLCAAIPIDLETIVLKAIAEEPEQRYQTAADLAGDLARFLEDRPILVRRPSLFERWSRWRRRNPAAAGFSALAAGLLVAVAAVAVVEDVRTQAAFRRERDAHADATSALLRESKANDEARTALARESQERLRAQTMLHTTVETLDRVFARLVPERLGERRALTVTGEETGGLPTATQAVVSPDTAALLEDLRAVYDRLAAEEGTPGRLGLEAAQANRRVGEIQARLGNLDRAADAYRRAIDGFQSLETVHATPEIRLELARLHNALGGIYGHKPDLPHARQEYQLALGLLQSDKTPTEADQRFELAHTYYLLGRGPEWQLNAAVHPESGGPPGGPFRPGERPEPGFGPDFDPNTPGDHRPRHPPPGGFHRGEHGPGGPPDDRGPPDDGGPPEGRRNHGGPGDGPPDWDGPRGPRPDGPNRRFEPEAGRGPRRGMPPEDGPPHDGPPQDRPPHDGPPQDRPPHDGPAQDRPPGELSSHRPPRQHRDPHLASERAAKRNLVRPQELQRAIGLLEPLVREQPKNPAFRYLLAQCYRELPPSDPLPDISQPEKLLLQLVNEYPGVADYRFDLADTYAMLDVRELPPEEDVRAEQRLRSALKQSAVLVDAHPYATDYTVLHIHILHKLATLLREGPEGPGSGGPARLSEAAQLYQEAIRRQNTLVQRFPENGLHRFWAARISLAAARLASERHERREPREILEAAVAQAEPFYKAHPQSLPLKETLRDLYGALGNTLERQGNDAEARTAREKARQLESVSKP